MDETMLTARRRLKVLAKKGALHLVPKQVKLPHMTECITITASGHVFKPLVILPNKKNTQNIRAVYRQCIFLSFLSEWMTHNLFTYYSLLLICQLSYYRLTLLRNLQNERFLLLVDGHSSRINFKAALIFYIFYVDLVLISPHTCHPLQMLDVAVASPLKTYFKEEMSSDKFDFFIQNGSCIEKQTSRSLRDSMIKSFFTALHKSRTLKNVTAGFEATGIVPVNPNKSLSFCDDKLLRNYGLNCEENLNELFIHEYERERTEDSFTINLMTVYNEIKSLSIQERLPLNGLPLLIIENENQIERLDFD